jgi:DNA-binding CsgD family transcriptional regulator
MPLGGRDAPTLERDRELQTIRQGLTSAATGEGRRLLVDGPVGIGKSRLLHEAHALATASGMEVLHARAGELEREYPFGLVLRLLEARLAHASAAERRRLLRGRAGLATPVLMPGGQPAEHLATADEFALIHGLYWCIVNLAENGPTALIVDDVQWADDLSLRFLVYLAERLDDLPVALIIAQRAGEPETKSELVTRLSTTADQYLRPIELSRAGVQRLVAAANLDGATAEFASACWDATRGNPFLLLELLAVFRTDAEAGLRAHPQRVGGFAPQTVGRSVRLRLQRLGPDAVAIARAGAVLDEETSLPTVARLAGLSHDRAAAAAERLHASSVLARVDPVSFAHPMIRSAIYEDLVPDERPKAHAAAAELLNARGASPEVISRHLLVGSPIDAPWVVEALHASARAAAHKGAPGAAVRCLRRAVELSESAASRAAMLIDLGLVEAATGQTASLARFELALRMLDESDERARALQALGHTLYRFGRHAEAAETFRAGVALFDEEHRELALTFEISFICAALYLESLRDEAVARLLAVAETISSRRPRTSAERSVLAVLAIHRSATAPYAPADAEMARDALRDGALLGEGTGESVAITHAILALLMSGCAPEAERAVDGMLADARERGAALAFAEGSWIRSLIMLSRGRLPDAMADAQAALDRVERGWSANVLVPKAVLAVCLVERGELEAAAEILDTAERPAPGSDLLGVDKYFGWARGQLRLARGDGAGALEDFLAVGAIPYGRDNPGFLPWRSLAGRAASAVGDRRGALVLIDEEINDARSAAIPSALGAALAARAVVEDGPDAAGQLGEAIAILEAADAPLELAYALYHQGRVHRRAGRRVACREPLRRALEVAHQAGATALAERARDELIASGARPRRAALHGVEALTPSERRIAEMAATGSTSRAIAEDLFLTKNTVEWHLHNAYRKLGAGSRRELVEVLAAGRPGTAPPRESLPSAPSPGDGKDTVTREPAQR